MADSLGWCDIKKNNTGLCMTKITSELFGFFFPSQGFSAVPLNTLLPNPLG